MKAPIVTLLTDFGTKDHYVASMKGVILKVNPRCQVVDITHEVNPQDIAEGAFILANAYSYFPEGTVHLAVVDPEVGGKRNPLLIVTERYFFVGPDNGLFSLVLQREEIKEVYCLTKKRFFLREVSSTFHGRDLFSPVAGHLTLGVSPPSFGQKIDSWKTIGFPTPVLKPGRIEGQVIHIDSFGNLITNIEGKQLNLFKKDQPFSIFIGRRQIKGIRKGYWDAIRGELVCLIGSAGFLEIAVREGDARRMLKVRKGSCVEIRIDRKR